MTYVIKLGGSLLDAAALPACLDACIRYRQPVVIVPGGGLFAEQVRSAQKIWGFDELAAHRMAILGMQQMALLMHSLKPEFPIVDDTVKLRSVCPHNSIRIWSPQIPQLDEAGIPATWDISSDSLAAWLAADIQANTLIVVKAADVAEQASLPDLQQHGILDAAFTHYTAQASYRTIVMNKDHFLSTHD